MSYKLYSALLNQSGTNAPVATILENTLSGTPILSRVDDEESVFYTLTLAGEWIAGKTMVFFGPLALLGGNGVCGITVTRVSENVLKIETRRADTGSANADGVLVDTAIEIRVYPEE